MRVLVTNDDGVGAPGIQNLAAAVAAAGHEVVVAAPREDMSGSGAALGRLHVDEHIDVEAHDQPGLEGVPAYGVDGPPALAVLTARLGGFGALPDLVVSGINKGWNLGDDVTYSGTVAGALEAALLGVPGLAVSLARTRGEYDFSYSARAAAIVAASLFRKPLPPWTFLNINVPKGQPKGFRTTVQAKRNHITEVLVRDDPKGRPYYWIDEGQNEWEPHDRSDYQAVRDGYVSVTPLHPDLTAHHALKSVDELSLQLEAGVR